MASSSSLVSEDQFVCPICLDLFTQPVSTPCGHNFCKICIMSYWDDTPICQCPACKKVFETRPCLEVNTLISGLALVVMLRQVQDAQTGGSDQQEASCSGRVQDTICKDHNRQLDLFCRNEKVLLCKVCTNSHHVNHDVTSVQKAFLQMRPLLEEVEATAKKMIQERQQKIQAVKEMVKQSRTEAENAVSSSVLDLNAAMVKFQKEVEVMEEKQKAAEEHADRWIDSVEQEIDELQTTTTKLKKLKDTKDQLSFIQSFPHQSLLPPMMDLSTFRFDKNEDIAGVKESLNKLMSQMQKLLTETRMEVKQFSDGAASSNNMRLKQALLYEKDIRLDPDTAHRLLVVSSDGKKVHYSMNFIRQRNQILNPNRFTDQLAVLGDTGFRSGKFYFAVFVGKKTKWCLGVATASIQRKGPIDRKPGSGIWAILFLKDKFETSFFPHVLIHWGRVETVGVFVDYNEGKISFYDVQNATLIYSFTKCLFTEELYPYLNLYHHQYDPNLDPMVIAPADYNYDNSRRR
ncbi:E3 ubiquitin-protein ligase TRIM39-like [Antennarius striatus]|uniref:E3 ubiquitin-protein ligase TRIM39-like n=1 Tax=Antennarius striatus TaxID=241820 RepID=UPI0035ADDBB8